jgi:hypothetical protein
VRTAGVGGRQNASMKRQRRPCSSQRQSLTHGALSSIDPVPKGNLARSRPAVAHYQRAPRRVALAAMALNAVPDLDFNRLYQPTPASGSRDLELFGIQGPPR